MREFYQSVHGLMHRCSICWPTDDKANMVKGYVVNNGYYIALDKDKRTLYPHRVWCPDKDKF